MLYTGRSEGVQKWDVKSYISKWFCSVSLYILSVKIHATLQFRISTPDMCSQLSCCVITTHTTMLQEMGETIHIYFSIFFILFLFLLRFLFSTAVPTNKV